MIPSCRVVISSDIDFIRKLKMGRGEGGGRDERQDRCHTFGSKDNLTKISSPSFYFLVS